MFDWKITPGVVFHTIQSRLCKKWSNGRNTGPDASWLSEGQTSYMYITLWGYLVSHCMPNLLWERDKTRYICIYIQITDWVSCMAYPFSLLRLLFCIEVGLIVIYTQYTKHWWNLPFLFFQILFKIEEKFYKIPWFLFTIADKSKDVSIIYFLH